MEDSKVEEDSKIEEVRPNFWSQPRSKRLFNIHSKFPFYDYERASSSCGGSGGLGLSYGNKTCRCGKNAEIKVSTTETNTNRLFYICRNKTCGFFQNCNPISGEWPPSRIAKAVENDVSSEDVRIRDLEKDMTKLKKHVKILEATVGFLKLLVLVLLFMNTLIVLLGFISVVVK